MRRTAGMPRRRCPAAWRCIAPGNAWRTQWALTGEHNRANAVAALLARHVGVPFDKGARGTVPTSPTSSGGWSCGRRERHHRLMTILPIIRRHRDHGRHSGARWGARILAVLEPRSEHDEAGVMKDQLPASRGRSRLLLRCQSGWMPAGAGADGGPACVEDDLAQLVERRSAVAARPGDHVLVMSNGGFGGVLASS